MGWFHPTTAGECKYSRTEHNLAGEGHSLVSTSHKSFPPRKKTASKKMPYHYYKPRGSDECVTYIQNESSRRGNHHRFITEKQVFARWAKRYNITFTHPMW